MNEKKVLFILWNEKLYNEKGGVHRCISNLLQFLPAEDIEAHYMYTLDNYQTFHHHNYNEENVILRKNLNEYLCRFKCNIILGQEAVFSTTVAELVNELNNPNIKLVNQFHSSLLLLDKKLSLYFLREQLKKTIGFKNKSSIIARILFYPLWKRKVWRYMCRIYKYNYYNSDVCLLLTKYEKPILSQIVGISDPTKCVSIPNSLSWPEIEHEEILNTKKNEVLIVSRIYNPEKRLDRALKVWKILQNQGIIDNWTLRILGDGDDRIELMDLSTKLGLRNVVWEGRKPPLQYYQNAKIFMMTSACEGWGLTLTESMQTGVVPIAFDSYPALREIINDGVDGAIVPDGDIHEYANRMEQLIVNNELREKLALNALKNCQRFSIERIMSQWSKMIKQL